MRRYFLNFIALQLLLFGIEMLQTVIVQAAGPAQVPVREPGV